MVYIHVQHTVEDYARWREGFDNHAAARQASGATDEAYVLRNVDNPNEITVVLGWSDVEKARAFTQSASLKEAMQKAGVTGPPEIRFLEAVE
jgi:heme-degrading monooxygenase HmoA